MGRMSSAPPLEVTADVFAGQSRYLCPTCGDPFFVFRDDAPPAEDVIAGALEWHDQIHPERARRRCSCGRTKSSQRLRCSHCETRVVWRRRWAEHRVAGWSLLAIVVSSLVVSLLLSMLLALL